MTAEAIHFQTTPVVTFGYIMQVVLSLLIVLAFIYLISRFILPRMKESSGGKFIKVLDRVYLEPQVSAYILKVGKSVWLLAISNKQVTRVDKIDESEL